MTFHTKLVGNKKAFNTALKRTEKYPFNQIFYGNDHDNIAIRRASENTRYSFVSFFCFFLLTIPFWAFFPGNRVLFRSHYHPAFQMTAPPNGCRAARFLHDKHTKALADKGCAECHPAEKEKFVFKFKRAKDAGYEAEKKMYHDNCIGCHQERNDRRETAGPLASDCRLCHGRDSKYQSSALPFGQWTNPLHFPP